MVWGREWGGIGNSGLHRLLSPFELALAIQLYSWCKYEKVQGAVRAFPHVGKKCFLAQRSPLGLSPTGCSLYSGGAAALLAGVGGQEIWVQLGCQFDHFS